ncbi:PAS domain S-box protein [Methanosarcina mazei]|nr:PAS domain S-box protein [Methanosarcina mazei]
MSSKLAKDQGNMSHQELLDKNRSLEAELQDLKMRLGEAEELRRAISEGDLDALIIPGPQEKLIFTLDSADRAYRVLVEAMNEGTATLASDGTILYCNRQFAELTKMSSGAVVGTSIYGFIAPEDAITFKALLKQKNSVGELKFRAQGGTSVPVYLSISSLQSEGSPSAWCLVVTDLTEQKKNEEIVAAERLARSIIEQAAEAIVVCDTTGRITYFSNTVSKVCKCDPAFKRFEDIIDIRLSEGEDAGKGILPVSSALKGATILGLEATLEHKSCQKFNQKLHLLLNSGPLRNSNGRIIGCVVTLTDITERKKMERELQESEEKYRNIVETANEGIWILDPEARITYVNQRMAEMLGYNHEEIIGRSAWDFTGDEGKEAAKQSMEKGKQRIDRDHELKLISKNGTPLWTIVSAKALFDKDGNFMGSMKMLTNITERKEAEVKLKQTLNNLEKLVQERTIELEKAYGSLKESERGLAEAQKMAHIGNWDRSLITNEVHWSDEVYRIFGFKPKEFGVTYSTYLNCVHPDDQDRVIKAAKQALEGKLSSIDYRIVLNNGEERVVHEEFKVVFDEKSNPVQLRGTVQDITERKKAEETLEKMDKIRIKEIHHRIKNNLQVICSLLSLEAERFSDEKMLETLKESQNRVASMALIHEELYKGDKNDTLDFAAYLRKLTADLFSSYNLGNDNISLKMDLEQVYLDMDTAIPLGIIVNELFSNSLKHAFPAGSEGEVHISLRRAETFDKGNNVSDSDQHCNEIDNFRYILRVADNGKGISKEIEIENADSLGLQLVNILVDQIDGCVELSRNCGTEFTIWFGDKEP